MADLKKANELITVNTSSPKSWRQLTCIEYPGIVKNEEKAIQTLGGLSTIAKACGEKSNRLEVRARPSSVYSKPAIGKPVKTCSLVIKLRRIKIEEGGEKRGEGNGYMYSAELVGLVTNKFEFNGMFDFQVIPPGLNSMTHKGSVLPYDPMAVMNDLMDDSCLSKDFPIFLPPLAFSKFDHPSNFAYKPDPVRQPEHATVSLKKKKQLIPGHNRIKRFNYAYGILFTHKEVPDKPHPDAPQSNNPKLKLLRQLFEDRPIWPRVALQAKTKLTPSALRLLLPLIGYYFTNGPWKKLWIKYGYDPRANATSKIYQCLDYRVPRYLEHTIVTHSSAYHKLLKPLGAVDTELKQHSLVSQSDEDSIRLAESRMSDTIDEEEDESMYIYCPDVLPRQRQQLYMLCDIHQESVQSLVHCNDGKEREECDEILGWCEKGSYDKIRKILSECIIARARKEGHEVDEAPPTVDEAPPTTEGEDPESMEEDTMDTL